eukprot:2748991-Pyramimonas_sp.AAC.1
MRKGKKGYAPTCWNCGKEGHKSDNCWQKSNPKGDSRGGEGRGKSKGKGYGKKDVNQVDEGWGGWGPNDGNYEGGARGGQGQPGPEEAGGLELCAFAPPICVIDSDGWAKVNFDSGAAAAVIPSS